MLESVEGIGRLARYSFIGHTPSSTIISKDKNVEIKNSDIINIKEGELLDYLQKRVKLFKHPNIKDLPDFTGGIVGYMGFEIIAEIEESINFSIN